MALDNTIKSKPKPIKVEYEVSFTGSSAGNGFAMPGLVLKEPKK